MEGAGAGKRRLVLPAPPPLKRQALVHSDQNEAVNVVAPPPATLAPQHAGDDGDGALDEEEEALGELLSDTEAALQLLKSQFQAKGGRVPPFALKSQLYSILQDRTLVDRQLDELRHRNKLRLFQLPTGGDDYALMLTDDYSQRLASSARQLAAAGKGSLVHVFDWFRDRVLPACCDVMVTHRELLALLRGSGADAREVTDAHLSLLLNQGFLTRHTNGTDGYVFSMPGAGPAVRSIREGRLEIVQALQRRRYPEILERELEKRKLQRSVLGVRFHVRDMLGSGALLRIETTVGAVLRLPSMGKK